MDWPNSTSYKAFGFLQPNQVQIPGVTYGTPEHRTRKSS